jgi:hypothetical protein
VIDGKLRRAHEVLLPSVTFDGQALYTEVLGTYDVRELKDGSLELVKFYE